MIKPNFNLHLFLMINKKKIIFFLIFILLNNCSFDDKTGIWNEREEEKRKISELEKKQKQTIKVDKVFSSDHIYQKEKSLANHIALSKPQNNLAWKMTSLNHQNFIGNAYLSGIDKIFLKKKNW